MRDVVLLVALVLAFATFVTAHFATVFGLSFDKPRWRGPVAFLAPPLAPYWAIRSGMNVRAGLWIGSLVLYVAARFLASR